MKAKAPRFRSGVALVLASAIPVIAGAQQNSSSPSLITVNKSPSCGCCVGWVDHLRDSGFEVEVNDTSRLRTIKAEHDIPQSLWSCHTATVAGYTIEGHVPASDIRSLLDRSPDVDGIAVSGMPVGSPGMEMGSRQDAFKVQTFNDGEVSDVFTRYGNLNWWK